MNLVVLRTVVLLFLSNCFMTLAWYGHLRFKNASIVAAIIGSWLLALPEYALQVPANRLGYGTLSGYQLKILQECITLVVFMGYAWLGLREAPGTNQMISFALILAAVAIGMQR